MKKKLIIVLCLVMAVFAFAACSSDSDTTDDNSTDSATQEELQTNTFGNENGSIAITKSKDGNSMQVVFSDGSDDTYKADLKFNKKTDVFENEDLSVKVTDDTVTVEAISDVAETLAGEYGLQG